MTWTPNQATTIVHSILKFIENVETVLEHGLPRRIREMELSAARVLSSLLSKGDEYVARCLAVYADVVLQNRLRWDQSDIEKDADNRVVLQKLAELVRYCHGKEIFQLELINRTSSRLLQHRSQS
uniref:Uncharacterized protein n=1 Tax=Lygus hesperus TaxID=30085 RepID=A0A146KWS0_LYGHE